MAHARQGCRGTPAGDGERAEELAAERQDASGEPDRLAAEIARLEKDNQASDAWVAQAVAAEGQAEAAAATAALAEAGEARRGEGDARRRCRPGRSPGGAPAELARDCGEQFECPPPLLPEKLDFDPAALDDAETEKASLDRMTAERERIGLVNLVAEQELAELEESRVQAPPSATSCRRRSTGCAARSAASTAKAACGCSRGL